MKKYLYTIVFAALILMNTTVVHASNEVYYINNNNIEMTETEYNNLLGLGFTEKQIYLMDQEEFLDNKDLEGTVLSETLKYIKNTTVMRNGIKYTTTEEITREEAMAEKELQSQGIPNRGPAGNYYDGIIVTTVLATTTKIVGISNTYMRFKTDTEWLTLPSDRYYDIIGVGMEAYNVEFGSIIVFKEHWTTGGVTYTETICYPKYMSTGGLAIFELPNGSITSLDATLYFNVKKVENVGTINQLYAAGDYAHAISNVNPSDVLNYTTVNHGGGLVITPPYANTYQSNSAAIASFVGTW